jgi:hypothetical protein
MTDADRRTLTPGSTVYYLDDRGEYQQRTVSTAPWRTDLGKWIIGLDASGGFFLDRVIGRDLADVEAHRAVKEWDRVCRTSPWGERPLLHNLIAAAIRAAEQRGRDETLAELCRNVPDPDVGIEFPPPAITGTIRATISGQCPAPVFTIEPDVQGSGTTVGKLLASPPAPPEVIEALNAAAEVRRGLPPESDTQEGE